MFKHNGFEHDVDRKAQEVIDSHSGSTLTAAYRAVAIELAGSGEPPQPRCPKCKSKCMTIDYYLDGGRTLRCRAQNCDFAQFFGPSAPQPQPPKNSRRQMCTCTGSCRGAERLGPDWMCAMETCGICGWHKSDGHAPGCSQVCGVRPSAPSGSAGQEPEEFDPPCKCAIRNSRLKQGAIGPHHEYSCPQYGGVRPENEPQRMAKRVEPEGRAESAAETFDTVGHTKSVVRPVVSASPAPQELPECPICGPECPHRKPEQGTANPPKVEEIARDIVFKFGVQGHAMNYESVLEFLGPFFTKASHPPTEILTDLMLELHHALDMGGKLTLPVQIQMKKADEYLNGLVPKLAAPVTPVSGPEQISPKLAEMGRKIYGEDFVTNLNRMIDEEARKELKAPVSGNGTEPPDHVIDVAVTRIAQELDWHLPDTDLIEFGVTVYKEAIRMAGAASHNGQGWVRVDSGVLPKYDGETEYVQVYWKEEWRGKRLSSNREDESIASACGIDTCFIPYFLARHFHQATHWRPLPAPPSEADGPQEEK